MDKLPIIHNSLRMKFFILILFCFFVFSHAKSQVQCDFTYSLGNDTSVCENDTLLLDATTPGALYYLWQDSSTSSTYNAIQEGEYWCEVTKFGANLILNGDFEEGDTLFSSDYILGTGGQWGQLSNEGTYAINTSPVNVHTNFAPCGDHTSGTGNMMIINGSADTNAIIWSQTINVEADRNYQFSTWITSVVSANPAQLQFSINGVNFGSIFSPGFAPCNWQQFAEIWNAGGNTNAVISIVNQNTGQSGNDFALDDIIFYELCEYTDTILVGHIPLPHVQLGPDTTICSDDDLFLDVATANASYLWQDNSTNAGYTVMQEGFYWSRVTVDQCSNSDSIYVETMDCSVILILPNIFTPNNDGKNDLFSPSSSIGITTLTTTIFNRWGTKVYDSISPTIDWDGDGQSDGTYFWIINYKGLDGKSYEQKGWVELVR
jgi:gliding motility-associated-like protein